MGSTGGTVKHMAQTRATCETEKYMAAMQAELTLTKNAKIMAASAAAASISNSSDVGAGCDSNNNCLPSYITAGELAPYASVKQQGLTQKECKHMWLELICSASEEIRGPLPVASIERQCRNNMSFKIHIGKELTRVAAHALRETIEGKG